MLPPGQMIGTRYQINSLLGQGGMSNLYLARDLKHGGMVVVIKEMTARYSDPTEQKNAEDLFMREADLLAKLNHPHIPKVYDKFKFQGLFYLSMEYVDGEDLGKKLSTRPQGMPERQVAEWGLQMATVLYYLHMHKPDPIIFRDVKPSNMMILHKTQSVKLIDFGIARFLTPTKKGDTMRIGSPGYAPPEQYSGQTDPRSDVYALGVTLHHAVTGRDPTTTQTPFLLPPARDLNPAVSTAMAMVIEKSTQLDPDKRYPSMLEMKRELQGVLRNHGVIASQTAPNMGAAPGPIAPPTQVNLPPLPAASAPPATPTPAPVPVANQPQTPPPPTPGTVTTLPPKRRSFWPPLVLTGCLAASLATAWFFPGVVEDSQQGLAVVISKLKKNTLPSEPGAAGILLYQKGGPLPQALHLLAQARKATPGDPAVLLAWNNALVLSGTAPVGHLAVVAPEGQDLRGLALAQSVLNDVGGAGQHLVVVDLETYAPGKLARAVERAQSGRSARKNGELTPPDGLLIFAEAPVDTKVPAVYVAPKPIKPTSANAVSLPEAAPEQGRLLAQALPSDVKDALWVIPDVKPPEKSGVRFKVAPLPADAAGALLKASGGGWVVAGVDQAKTLLSKPDPDLKLLLWCPSATDLPEVGGLFKGDKGPSLVAVTGPSQLCNDPVAAAFFREYPLQFGSEAKPPEPAVARAYDGLQWAALRVWASGSRYAGVTVRVNGEGQPTRAAYSRWVGTSNGWIYKQDLEEAP